MIGLDVLVLRGRMDLCFQKGYLNSEDSVYLKLNGSHDRYGGSDSVKVLHVTLFLVWLSSLVLKQEEQLRPLFRGQCG